MGWKRHENTIKLCSLDYMSLKTNYLNKPRFFTFEWNKLERDKHLTALALLSVKIYFMLSSLIPSAALHFE
jgi:hypothetical protein